MNDAQHDALPAPLAGIRVVEFGQFIAGPAAAQALCDLGADVVKVEPAGGDAARRVAWPHDDCGPLFAPASCLNAVSQAPPSNAVTSAATCSVGMPCRRNNRTRPCASKA